MSYETMWERLGRQERERRAALTSEQRDAEDQAKIELAARIEAKIAETSKRMLEQGTFIEFDGMNCHEIGVDECDTCLGWDGNSHRCNCGNRRVSWVYYGTTKEGKIMINGEAY